MCFRFSTICPFVKNIAISVTTSIPFAQLILKYTYSVLSIAIKSLSFIVFTFVIIQTNQYLLLSNPNCSSVPTKAVLDLNKKIFVKKESF